MVDGRRYEKIFDIMNSFFDEITYDKCSINKCKMNLSICSFYFLSTITTLNTFITHTHREKVLGAA